jgi:hypothetical protein
MDYAMARRALEKLEGEIESLLDPEEMEALEGCVALFEPYSGDDPKEARQRTSAPAHCANCGYETPLMFFPAPAELACTAAMRLAQCPRCFSTTMMMGSAPSNSEST